MIRTASSPKPFRRGSTSGWSGPRAARPRLLPERRDHHLAHLFRGPRRRRRIGGADGRAWRRAGRRRRHRSQQRGAGSHPWCWARVLVGASPLLVAPPSLLGANSDLPRVLSATVRRTEAALGGRPRLDGRDRDQLWSAIGARLAGSSPRTRRSEPPTSTLSPLTSPILPRWWHTSSPRAPPVSPRSASGSTGRSSLPSTGWWLPWSSAKRTSSSTGPRSITTWVWSTTSSPAWLRGSHWC